jgi:hypothetical protein
MLAVIVIVVIAALAAIFVVARRRAGRARATRDPAQVDDTSPYRSHAEASRRSDAGRL